MTKREYHHNNERTAMRKFRIEIEQVNLPVGTESNSIDYQGNVWFTDKHGKSIAFLKDTVESHPHIFREITDNHDEELLKQRADIVEECHKKFQEGNMSVKRALQYVFDHALTLSKERVCVWTKSTAGIRNTSCGKEVVEVSDESYRDVNFCFNCGGKIVEEEKREEGLKAMKDDYIGLVASATREQAIGELIEFLENHVRESPTLNKLIAAVKEGELKK